MNLQRGTRLGPYEIVAPLGAGGMGEVYRARDTRLQRDVAVKILPAELAGDAKLRLRFEREAKAISALTHPHICTLHDIGTENGVDYLVMELLEGESLADRLARGPLPLGEVLRIGTQIAEALDRAHRHGVVHRDLKPGNVMITKSGAKLLDFGLARSSAQALTGSAPSVEATEQKPLTAEGAIVGTFQYMAPEQLEGADADARTDIFAFGALLYEMVTGQRAFSGTTRTSLIAAIVDRDPRPMTQLQPVTPPALEHVVMRCLRKDPDERWQSAYDIASELRWISEAGSGSGVAVTLSRRRRWREWTAWVAAMALAAALGVVAWRTLRVPKRIVITSVVAPAKTALVFESGTAVLSPDGTQLVFPAVTDGPVRLWVRQLDSEEARPLAATDGAQFPFWSPDGKSIGFFADGRLKRVDAGGGPAETLASAPTGRGGAWNRDGVILFAPSTGEPLFRVSANGGDAQPCTRLDVKRGDTSHRFPAFAPDGRHFAIFAQGVATGNVLLGSLDSQDLRVLTTADANVVFAGDYLLYVRDRMLRAQRVDLEAGKLIGNPVNIADRIQTSAGWNFSNFSVSSNGLLSYVTGNSVMTRLRWVDRQGKDLGLVTANAAEHYDPRLLPDGKTLLFARAGQGGLTDVWMFDLVRSVPTRLTYAPANEFTAIPSPDGRYAAYVSFDASPGDIYIKRTDGAGDARPLVRDSRRKIPSDFTPDGRYLLYHAITPGRQWDLEKYSMEEKKAYSVLATPFAESGARISPDGQWISYTSDESGKHEVYVQHFTDPRGKWQISDGGGLMSSWSRDGTEIYYYSPEGKMMAATVRTGKEFSAEPAHVLFPIRLAVFPGMTRVQYDVSRDGRFVVNAVATSDGEPLLITLVQNWELKLE